MLLVVLYHVWVGKVSGGVDVFLFISAFLLSLSFMRKINEGKPSISSATGCTSSSDCYP